MQPEWVPLKYMNATRWPMLSTSWIMSSRKSPPDQRYQDWQRPWVQAKFHWYVEDQGLRYAYIKPSSPQLNGKVEWPHRSYQQAKLAEWENFYNFARPHGAHNRMKFNVSLLSWCYTCSTSHAELQTAERSNKPDDQDQRAPSPNSASYCGLSCWLDKAPIPQKTAGLLRAKGSFFKQRDLAYHRRILQNAFR